MALGNRVPARLATACVSLLAGAVSIVGAGGTSAASPGAGAAVATASAQQDGQQSMDTSTPIKHLVVIYLENRSFDHFFGTYPQAANPPGEPAFHAAPGTPAVNGLSGTLLTSNPNQVQPYRLDRSAGLSNTGPAGPNHSYKGVQRDYDNGRVDQFVQVNGTGSEMGYYDGNTVTGLWNYAQHFAMTDDNFETTFGPSRPQIINLISGQTHGAVSPNPTSAILNGTLVSNLGPLNDDCGGNPVRALQMTGKNIGDLLNAKGVTWGYFKQGFAPTARAADGTAVCGATFTDPFTGESGPADDAEDDPFQHYPSTANLHHLPPSSPAMIGYTDQANHQYDLSDFWQAAGAGNMPAVSFLRTSGPFLSSPLENQYYLANTINQLERLPEWKSTAVVITWDESGGWYDHVMPPIVNDSQSSQDALTGPGKCGDNPPAFGGYLDRCGYGARIPELVISPYAKVNYVDHAPTAQSAIIRFAEDNWHLGRIGDGSFDVHSGTIDGMFDFGHPSAQPLFVDPTTGEPDPGSGS